MRPDYRKRLPLLRSEDCARDSACRQWGRSAIGGWRRGLRRESAVDGTTEKRKIVVSCVTDEGHAGIWPHSLEGSLSNGR